MADSEHDLFIEGQFQELQAKHRYLKLHNNGKGYTISGELTFSSEYGGVRIQDCFLIFIEIPDKYPEKIPIAKEIGGRIPRDFHKFSNEILCLGTPADQWIKFNTDKSLLGFVDNLVVPYLFSFCFKQEKRKMPFGERSHGGLGILEFYCEYFELTDLEAARKLLKLLASGRYRRKKICPCRSGRRLGRCHGPKSVQIMKVQSISVFKEEYNQALNLGEKK